MNMHSTVQYYGILLLIKLDRKLEFYYYRFVLSNEVFQCMEYLLHCFYYFIQFCQ